MSSEVEQAVDNAVQDASGRMMLSVDIKDAGACRRHISVTVSEADIRAIRGEALRELSGKAQVPGFRVGKVPFSLLEKRFRAEIASDIKQKVLLASLEQISEEYKIEPIGEPRLNVENLEIPAIGDFHYEFDVEVRPEFDLPDFASIVIKRPTGDATPEDLSNYLTNLLTSRSQVVATDDPASEGDHLVCDMTFTWQGKVLREVTGEPVRLMGTLNFQDAVLDDFTTLMTGVKVGDTRQATLQISLQSPVVEMRGETVDLSITVQEVAHNVVPELNSEFIEQLGFSTEEEFTELVRESVERQLLFGQRQETRNQLLQSITAAADWELPEGLVRQQTDNALRRELLEMTQAGFTQMQIRNRENEIRQNALESTRAALKQHFILDKIATAESIDATESEIDHELLMMSYQRGEPVRRIRARLVKSGMIENLYAQLRERKTIDFLLEKVSFEDVPHEPIALETASSTRFAICGNMAPTLIDDGAEVEDSE